MSTSWVVVPAILHNEMYIAGWFENKKGPQARWTAMLAARPTRPDVPVPVDPAELETLRRDAACFQWLMSLQSGRPESQIALAQVILAMRKNPEAVRKFIEGQIALAANGEKGT